MATVKISALPTLVAAIDRAADYIPLVDTSLGVTNKLTPNTFLGITGSPVGTTDSQTLTTKVLDNTNTVTLKDTLFTLQDDGDTTKRAQFQLSGITTGTTRTYTLPNASSTLADIATAQTFTNKTLTSPVISGGTIDNTTITVDSISGHTTASIVTVGNVQLNNGTIGTSNAVVTASIADSAVTPAKLVAGTGTGWAWSNWVPVYTNLTIGNGTVEAKYVQIGKTIFGRFFFQLGSSSAVGSNPTITLPVAALASYYTTFGSSAYIGEARFIAAAAGYNGAILAVSATTMSPVPFNTTGTFSTESTVTAAQPGAWTTGNQMFLTFSYEVA